MGGMRIKDKRDFVAVVENLYLIDLSGDALHTAEILAVGNTRHA